MIETAVERVNRILIFLRDRSKAYKLCFPADTVATKIVLADLARFCRAHESCVVPGDNDLTKVLEGRREVWLRIEQHLNLSSEQLYSLYNQGKTPNG